MNKEKISAFRIDYTDGSYDKIEPGFQEDPMMLYNLYRNKRRWENNEAGAYTNAAIAALLFFTIINNEYTFYRPFYPHVKKLLKFWDENLRGE